MMRIDILFILIFVGFSTGLLAQEVLTKEAAIAALLDRNYNIRLAQNSVELASAGATKSNAGFYPTVQLNAGASMDYGSSNQQFQDGSEIMADANLTQLYNGSLGVNYTIYQGGERRLNLQKLYEQVDVAEIQKRQQIELAVLDLLSIYYEAAQAKEQLRLQEELVGFSEERLDNVLNNFNYGRGSSLDVNNARVDLQRDKANLISARMRYDQAKRDLLMAMGSEDMQVDFDVETEVEYDLVEEVGSLEQSAVERNVQLALVEGDRQLLEYDRDILKARQLPTLSFSTDYAYSFQDFGDGGFFAQQSSNGVGAGLSLTWNIYDGGRIKTQKNILRVQLEGNAIQREQIQLQLKNQVRNLYANYQTALQLVEVEGESIDAANLAFERSRDEYQLGRLGQLEFRQSQINLLNAQLAERTATYNAKLLEIQIMQLAGQLMNEEYTY